MKSFLQSVSPDAWVSSIGTIIGSFLGALIAGIIAISINRKNNLRLIQEEKKSQELHLKMLFPKFYPEIYALCYFVDAEVKNIREQMQEKPIDEDKIYTELLKLSKTLESKTKEMENKYNFTNLNEHDFFLCLTTIMGYKYIFSYMYKFTDDNGLQIKTINRIDKINTGLKKNIDRIAKITENYLKHD